MSTTHPPSDSDGDSPTTSTETLSPTEACECDLCETEYVLRDGYSRRFCSDICFWKGAANVALNALLNDHRYCNNCYRKIRDVEPPGRRLGSSDLNKPVPECAIGRAGFEPHTRRALAESYDRADPVNGEWHFEPVVPETATQATTEKRICACGACHYRTVHRKAFSESQLKTHAERLSKAIAALYDERKHEFDHSRDLLLEAVLSAKEKPENQFRDRTLLRNGLATSMCLTYRRGG